MPAHNPITRAKLALDEAPPEDLVSLFVALSEELVSRGIQRRAAKALEATDPVDTFDEMFAAFDEC